MRQKYDLLLKEKTELKSQLDIVHVQLEQLQMEDIKVLEKHREIKNVGATQTDMVSIYTYAV